MAARKFLIHDRIEGEHYEHEAVEVSDGAADAGEIPALNADGILDDSIMGAALSGADVVLKTGPTGRIPMEVLPVGVGNDTGTLEVGETLDAGNLINIYVDGAVWKLRRANASNGRSADGYVEDSFAVGEQAPYYREGTNGFVSGLTGKKVFLATTPGGVTSTAPTGAGVIQQPVGEASGATSFFFRRSQPTHLIS